MYLYVKIFPYVKSVLTNSSHALATFGTFLAFTFLMEGGRERQRGGEAGREGEKEREEGKLIFSNFLLTLIF